MGETGVMCLGVTSLLAEVLSQRQKVWPLGIKD